MLNQLFLQDVTNLIIYNSSQGKTINSVDIRYHHTISFMVLKYVPKTTHNNYYHELNSKLDSLLDDYKVALNNFPGNYDIKYQKINHHQYLALMSQLRQMKTNVLSERLVLKKLKNQGYI